MKSDFNQAWWRFALGVTFARLEQLVWKFDVGVETGEKGYANVPTPNELTTIIAGFLEQKDQLLLGDVTRLEKMQLYSKDYLAPVYQNGQQHSQQQWTTAKPSLRYQLQNLSPSEVRERAWNIVPREVSPTEANWCVEGFCRRWWEIDYVEHILNTAK